MFDSTSRYRGLPELYAEDAQGRRVAYCSRRFLPLPGVLQARGVVAVRDGDRLDTLAYRAFGDAELSWRLVDANPELDPDELTREVGARLSVPSTEL